MRPAIEVHGFHLSFFAEFQCRVCAPQISAHFLARKGRNSKMFIELDGIETVNFLILLIANSR